MNKPQYSVESIGELFPFDIETQRAFYNYKLLEASSKVAGYLNERGIAHTRLVLAESVSAVLPVEMLKYLSEHEKEFNIAGITGDKDFIVI